MGKKINDIIVKGHYTELIGIKKVVKGILHEIEDEIDGGMITVGDGEALYNVSDDRKCNHFLLYYKKNGQ